MEQKLVALLVEDENEWLQIFEEAFSANVIILKARSLNEAHKVLNNKNRKIDIALVDIFLEEGKANVSGLDVMLLLSKERIPCIAITAYDDGRIIRDAFVIGKAQDVWFKSSEKLLALREKIARVIKRER